jgi:hypothetical protein
MPAVLGVGSRRVMRRNEFQNISIPPVDIAKRSLADVDCLLSLRRDLACCARAIVRALEIIFRFVWATLGPMTAHLQLVSPSNENRLVRALRTLPARPPIANCARGSI